ncbi:pyridoxine 5'-phosphate synthase [Bacteroidia bacterium]|nr:pyridoxine 5'-phosphate synthase [Bacteroidia bacterium]
MRLSVNINKVATLRNARGGRVPDVLQVAADCQRFGAQGITVHPRPDERHIRYQDVRNLKAMVATEYNIEGYPSPQFMQLVLDVQPTQVTLVPDEPLAITSNAGWDVVRHKDFLTKIVEQLHGAGIRSSIFVAAHAAIMPTVAGIGANRVELYTEPYAAGYAKDAAQAIAPFVEAAGAAAQCGLEVNAGHDLNLDNLHYFAAQIPFVSEVSIGHALICDALYFGLENTIQMYLQKLKLT